MAAPVSGRVCRARRDVGSRHARATRAGGKTIPAERVTNDCFPGGHFAAPLLLPARPPRRVATTAAVPANRGILGPAICCCRLNGGGHFRTGAAAEEVVSGPPAGARLFARSRSTAESRVAVALLDRGSGTGPVARHTEQSSRTSHSCRIPLRNPSPQFAERQKVLIFFQAKHQRKTILTADVRTCQEREVRFAYRFRLSPDNAEFYPDALTRTNENI